MRIRCICWKRSSIRSGFAGRVIVRRTRVVLGRTTGRGKNDLTHKPNRSIKEVLALPVHRRFRELLTEVR